MQLPKIKLQQRESIFTVNPQNPKNLKWKAPKINLCSLVNIPEQQFLSINKSPFKPYLIVSKLKKLIKTAKPRFN